MWDGVWRQTLPRTFVVARVWRGLVGEAPSAGGGDVGRPFILPFERTDSKVTAFRDFLLEALRPGAGALRHISRRLTCLRRA